ncbi:hypothetical protein PR202_ga29808 [Eleusine coracana subsp. coracana]|uniref:AAA+ ATPase domain-containing protein n=1 Tax=Eleusine coracana subsp. coracana TaxID=191504 RepID=A0AAV5DNA6_ELECO|nr:hypothetical protein PR202_ga29808 [Eleusine coracana subsp. coracana]
MDLSSVLTSPSYGKAAETYKKAVAAAATAATYTMMARSMSRDLFPDELRGAARWAASVVRARLLRSPKQRRTKTIFINQEDNRLYDAARSYLATRIDPHAATRHCLVVRGVVRLGLAPDVSPLRRGAHGPGAGPAWKRGYLLYGPPGTGKSSLVAAMANQLRFDLYDLDLSEVLGNSYLQKLLSRISDKSILVIEDIDCCFSAASRENDKDQTGGGDDGSSPAPGNMKQKITLSGLLNFIDGLWSTSGEERIVIFTTNYKDRLDPALLRAGRMDMHIYMGYCGWEAFKTLAKNYFLLDDHPLFQEIQDLLAEVEVTPATVSEMLLRSKDAGVALQGFVEFLQNNNNKGDKP